MFRGCLNGETEVSVNDNHEAKVMKTILTTVCVASALAIGSPAWATVTTWNFDSDPGWVGVHNVLDIPSGNNNDFFWRSSDNADGVLSAGTGEIGGFTSRVRDGGTALYAAYYTDIGSMDPSTDLITVTGRMISMDPHWTSGYPESTNAKTVFGLWDRDGGLSTEAYGYYKNELYLAIDAGQMFIGAVANNGVRQQIALTGYSYLNQYFLPTGRSIDFTLNYNSATGALSANVDGDTGYGSFVVTDKDAFANLNTLGIHNLSMNTHIPEADTGEMYWDDLAYTIPEPSALVLLGIGLIGLLAYAWRKRK